MAIDTEFPTIVDVSLDAGDASGQVWIEYGLDDALDRTTPRWDSDGTLDTSVLGLKAGRTYQLRVKLETDDGTVLSSGVWRATLGPRHTLLPAFDVTVAEDGRQVGGFIVLTLLQADRSWVVAIDREGDYVWWQDVGEGRVAPTVKLAENGTDLLYGSYDNGQIQDLGEIVRQPIAGGEQVRTRTLMGHHDFFEGPGGAMYWLAYETKTFDLDGVLTSFTGDVVLRAAEGSGDDAVPALVWNSFDHLPEPEIVCSHVEDVMPSTGGHDWTHSNSLIYDRDADAFIYVPRHLDRVMFIDRSTGDIRWVLGDEGTLSPAPGGDTGGTDTGASGEPLLDHLHLSQASESLVVAFDNGDHRDPQASSLSVFEIQPRNETYERVFHWQDPEGRFVPILGDLISLPDGTWLSSWTNSGLLVELDAGGEVVWSAAAAIGTGTGRVVWVPDLYDMRAD